jgi:hypothetical protein
MGGDQKKVKQTGFSDMMSKARETTKRASTKPTINLGVA